MRTISIGKYHRLKKCSSPAHSLSVLAIDHRTSLLKAIGKHRPGKIGVAELAEFKLDIIEYIGNAADAILLDPEFGAPAYISAGVPEKNKGLVLSVEKSGYSGNPTLRENDLLSSWNIHKTIRLAADAVKLLVYYHPAAQNKAVTEALIAQVAQECETHEIPFFLEVLTYSLDPKFDKIPGDERRKVVVETARQLSGLGADVLKLEFPADISAFPDHQYWADTCAALTEASLCPWILLSASVDFETYYDQVSIACQKGSSGIAVGRAVWKEAVPMESRSQRIEFLSQTAHTRMEELNLLCQAAARPWTDYYAPPEISEQWHSEY